MPCHATPSNCIDKQVTPSDGVSRQGKARNAMHKQKRTNDTISADGAVRRRTQTAATNSSSKISSVCCDWMNRIKNQSILARSYSRKDGTKKTRNTVWLLCILRCACVVLCCVPPDNSGQRHGNIQTHACMYVFIHVCHWGSTDRFE